MKSILPHLARGWLLQGMNHVELESQSHFLSQVSGFHIVVPFFLGQNDTLAPTHPDVEVKLSSSEYPRLRQVDVRFAVAVYMASPKGKVRSLPCSCKSAVPV